jgi:hypothetical protein
MEIVETNKTGITRLGNDIRIKYAIQGNESTSLSGVIYRDDVIAGYCNAEKSGVFGFSLQSGNSLSSEEIKGVFDAIVTDASQIFGQSEDQTESSGVTE